MSSNPVAATSTSDIAPALTKVFDLDIQATKECIFTLKRICDMIRTCSQFLPCLKLRKVKLKVTLSTYKFCFYTNLIDEINMFMKSYVVNRFFCPGCNTKYIGKNEPNICVWLEEGRSVFQTQSWLTVCCYHVTYHFRVNPHSIFAGMSRKSLLETGAISEV